VPWAVACFAACIIIFFVGWWPFDSKHRKQDLLELLVALLALIAAIPSFFRHIGTWSSMYRATKREGDGKPIVLACQGDEGIDGMVARETESKVRLSIRSSIHIATGGTAGPRSIRLRLRNDIELALDKRLFGDAVRDETAIDRKSAMRPAIEHGAATRPSIQ
jgi:hypothetical protein